MANVKISQLPGAATLSGNDVVPMVNILSGATPTGQTQQYKRWQDFNFYLNATGLSTLAPCLCASNTNLIATYNNGTSGIGAILTSMSSGVFVCDGITPVINSAVLVAGQTSALQNGIYILTNAGSLSTPWILTRANYYDTPTQIIQYQVTLVLEGTLYGGIAFQQQAAGPFTVGVTDIVFTTFDTSTAIQGTLNRITVTNSSSTSIIDIAANYIGQTSITKLGTITIGTWQSTVIDGTYINYNTTNLKVTANQLNTIQDIASTSSPTFKTITISGTLSTASTNLVGASFTNTITPTTGTTDYQSYLTPTFTLPTAGSITAYGEAINLTFNGSGTAGIAAAIFTSAFTLSSGAVTNAYGAYLTNPGVGTNKTALYADDGCFGYTATTPPTNGVVILGRVGMGTSSPNSFSQLGISGNIANYISLGGVSQTQVDGSSNQSGFTISPIFAPTNGSTRSAGVYVNTILSIPTTKTTTTLAAFYATNQGSSFAGTVTTLYGYYFDGGSAGLSTITNAYGAYFAAPLSGTHVTALYADNLSVGYTGITPGTNSALISGQVAVGTSSPQANTAVTISGSQANGLYVKGTLATGSSNLVGIWGINTFTPTSGTQCFQLVLQPTITSPAGGLTAAIGTYTNLTLNGSGVIANAYGIKVDTIGLSGATVTAAYGGYFVNPGIGTTKTALYADDICIGYAGVTPPTNGALINGAVGIGTSSVFSGSQLNIITSSSITQIIRITGTQNTVDGGSNMMGIGVFNTVQPTSGGNLAAGIWSNPAYIAPTAQTIATAAAVYLSNNISGNIGTITAAYGLRIDQGSSSAGTVTTHYGLSVSRPAGGTNRYTAVFDTIVGIGTAPSADRILYISGDIRQTVSNFGLVLTPALGATSGTIASSFACYINPLYNINAGTVTAAYGAYIDSGSTGGTITAGYNLYVARPAFGTSKYTAYFDPVVGIGTTPSSDTILIIAGNLAQTVSNYGIYLNPRLGATSGTVAITAGMYIYTHYGNNAGTITNAYALWIDAGFPGGTITTSYGLYVNLPAFGTTNICAYFQGPIKIGVNTTGAGTALLGASNCPAGTLSAPYNWLKFLSPDGSTVYVPGWK